MDLLRPLRRVAKPLLDDNYHQKLPAQGGRLDLHILVGWEKRSGSEMSLTSSVFDLLFLVGINYWRLVKLQSLSR